MAMATAVAAAVIRYVAVAAVLDLAHAPLVRAMSHATQQQQCVVRYVAVAVVLDVAEAPVLVMAMKVSLFDC